MDTKTIVIIGAGPVGCYAAHLLADQGHEVTVYENHPQIGSPVQCTGLLTGDFDELGLPIKSFLVNTIDSIEVNSPNHKIELAQKEYLVCRVKFDNFFADLARKSGATLLTNHAFVRKEGRELIIYNSVEKKEIRVLPDLVIAADGPLSPTAKAHGLYHSERENYYGIQATVEGDFAPAKIQTYFSNEACPGLFAWVVSESSTRARVGLAAKKNSREYFDAFMKKNGYQVVEMQAGTIPLYHPAQKLQQDNCYVVGDAAGFVKATTLGGLIPGLKQAKALARSIQLGTSYEKESAPIAKRLRMHLRIRKILDKFNDKDFDRLVKYVGQSRVLDILQTHTRENPLPILLKVGIREPRFAYFLKHFV